MDSDGKNRGWIKLYRKFTEWEWYTDSYAVHLFLHLLLTANVEDKKWRGIVIKRGQVVTGRRMLSEETNIPEITIRRKLTILNCTGAISIKTTNKGSIITICKYDDYQASEPTSEPTSEPLLKNIRNKEYISPPSARACEGKLKSDFGISESSNSGFLEDGFYQELKSDQNVKERSCMNLHITTEQYDKLLEEFADECTIKRTYHNGGRSDYYAHAFDWMRKHLEIIKNQKQKGQNNGTEGRKLTPKEQFIRDTEQNEDEWRKEAARVALELQRIKDGGELF